MSRKSVRIDVLRQVVADAGDVFTTRDISEDERMHRAHPELVKHSHYHAFVGGALSDQHLALDIIEVQGSTARGSRWQKQRRGRMTFREYEVPVAYSMVRFVREQGDPSGDALLGFSCYWMAFNSIYVTVAARSGKALELKRENGEVLTEVLAKMKVPKTKGPSEREQMNLAVAQFSDDLEHRLIVHPSTGYFVRRSPYWNGAPIEQDALGQRLNGVLNVGRTVSRDHPVWSPVDADAWSRYIGGIHDAAVRAELARQIVGVLYTIRNNTFHGGKRADDASDHEVLEKAAPLLRMIVHDFLCE